MRRTRTHHVAPARRRSARVGLLLLATGTASLVTACAPDSQGGAGDAPIDAVQQEPWTVMNNVDGYPNVATRCYRGNGVYVTRSAGDNSDSLVVVPNDPACGGAGAAGGGASEPITPSTAAPR